MEFQLKKIQQYKIFLFSKGKILTLFFGSNWKKYYFLLTRYFCSCKGSLRIFTLIHESFSFQERRGKKQRILWTLKDYTWICHFPYMKINVFKSERQPSERVQAAHSFPTRCNLSNKQLVFELLYYASWIQRASRDREHLHDPNAS